jgi:hypothetical protein
LEVFPASPETILAPLLNISPVAKYLTSC